jgi:lipoyl(octanoyl) transferase
MTGAGRTLEVQDLGLVSYARALDLQASLVRKRRAGEIPDQLLLLEHPHVITLGSSSRDEHILLDESEREARGIELFETGRGGDVTYHGPGQLVGYPILDLKPDRKDLHRYIRDLERVLIEALSTFGIEGWPEEGRTGVWTESGKIAAIGVRVSSGWITSHGFALNVSTDLGYFETIVPCGLDDRRVTSISALLGGNPDPEGVSEAIVRSFADVFDIAPTRGGPSGQY